MTDNLFRVRVLGTRGPRNAIEALSKIWREWKPDLGHHQTSERIRHVPGTGKYRGIFLLSFSFLLFETVPCSLLGCMIELLCIMKEGGDPTINITTCRKHLYHIYFTDRVKKKNHLKKNDRTHASPSKIYRSQFVAS